jgi:riboflavin synthase alpha subunit
MFTGIVEEVGRVVAVQELGNGVSLTIGASPCWRGSARGTASRWTASARP